LRGYETAYLSFVRPSGEHNVNNFWQNKVIFTTQRYSSMEYAVVVCPSVCHKPALCQNDYT